MAVAVVILVITLSAVGASAAPTGLALEWRVIMDENPPPGFTPVLIGPLAGGRYIAVIGVSSQAHTWLYLVDAATQNVARKIDLGPGKPLCASRQDASLSILMDMGRGKIEEKVVTPDLHIIEGISTAINTPVILSGCSKLGNNYLVYGSQVTNSTGLDAYAALVNQGGIVTTEISWSGPADEAIYLVAPVNNSSAYAVVSNLSSPKNYTIYFLKIINNKIINIFIKNINNITIYDISYNKSLLLVGSLTPTNPVILIIDNNHKLKLMRLPHESRILSVAGYDYPYAYLTGIKINTTTMLLNGLSIIVNILNDKIIASDIAIGKNNVTLSASMVIGDHLYVAGMHGDTPILLSYIIEYSASPARTAESPVPGGALRGEMLLYVGLLLLLAMGVLAVLVYVRRKR